MKIKQLTFLLIITTGLFACKKGYDLPQTASVQSSLNVINTSADTLNYYLNGTRQNYTSTIYPAGYTGYLSVTSNTQNYEFRKNGTATVIFNKSIKLIDSTKNYQTLYVAGTTADKAFLTIDTISTVSAAGSIAKFVNTADGAGALSIAVNDTLVFKNQSFKSVSAAKLISPGIKVVKVYAGSAATPVVTQKITFSVGNIYTLYVKGVPNGVGQAALVLGIFVNK